MTNENRPVQISHRAKLNEIMRHIRPQLHRYVARMTGSVIDGEDVVQDTFALALSSNREIHDELGLRAWLFAIAHNRSIDILRRRARVKFEDLDLAIETASDPAAGSEENLMRKETIQLAISHFSTLTVEQRSAVVLKDVLGEPISAIARLLDVSADAVKGHLARGRARLRDSSRDSSKTHLSTRQISENTRRFARLFNMQDWDGLRALLAEDVKLNQATYPIRRGSADVGTFFSIYASLPRVQLQPAWLEGREVLAVAEIAGAETPNYFMLVEWSAGKITNILDYRYVRYITENAEFEMLA